MVFFQLVENVLKLLDITKLILKYAQKKYE